MDDEVSDIDVGSAVELLSTLIGFPSVSSTSNAAITRYVAEFLEELGFKLSHTVYEDAAGVEKVNLVATRFPHRQDTVMDNCGGLAYFSHTDVVPVKGWMGCGNEDAFHAQVHEQRIYGRGACDMKGSLACMLTVASRIKREEQSKPLWIVCTADEEVGFDGARYVTQHCPDYRDLVRAQPVSIIGEPTEMNVVYAHKGIQGLSIRSQGRAGHSATRYGINANEAMVPMLSKLLEICHRTRESEVLQDPRFDPPDLSWNFGVSDHSDVVNITPGRSDAWVSIRTMPQVDGVNLFDEIRELAQTLGLTTRDFNGCDPMWTDPDDTCVKDMMRLCKTDPRAVCYATDGGVLTELKHRIVVGPGSIQQAHTIDEWISVDQIQKGIDGYDKAVRHWCVS